MNEKVLAVALAVLSVAVAASALLALGDGGVVYVSDTVPLSVNDKGVNHA